LLGVVGHESAKSEFLHCGEVEPVQRSDVPLRAVTVLPQCRLEDGPGQWLDRERVTLTQEAQPLGQSAIPRPGEAATKPRRAQLNCGLEFDQRRKHDLILPGNGGLHGRAFGLGEEEFQQ
jgi:hypothetical protein